MLNVLDHKLLPFGRGMRGCISADIALYQMKLTLATLVIKFFLCVVGL